MDTIDDVRHQLDKVETYLEAVEDERDALKAKVDSAERAAAGVRHLAEAVRMYFSWVESPPKGMDDGAFETLRRNFRLDVEQALREVEG
jgi:hypothetical protein